MIRSSLKFAQDAEINAVERVAKSLSALPEIERMVFFDSRVRGDFDGLSDIDLLIVVTDIRIKNRVVSILHAFTFQAGVGFFKTGRGVYSKSRRGIKRDNRKSGIK